MPRRTDITTTDCQTRAETPYIFSQKTRSQAPQTLLPVNEVLHSLTSADQQVTKLIASHHITAKPRDSRNPLRHITEPMINNLLKDYKKN
jgi:hypothetical protein